MQRFLVLLSVAVLAACGDSSQLFAPPPAPLTTALTETEHLFIPYSLNQFVPCANGGAGESVQLEGTLRLMGHITEAGGMFFFHYYAQPYNVSGYGVITGDRYHLVGHSFGRISVSVSATDTNTSSFQVIGDGPDNNFTAHSTWHFVFTPQGELTASVDNYRIECR